MLGLFDEELVQAGDGVDRRAGHGHDGVSLVGDEPHLHEGAGLEPRVVSEQARLGREGAGAVVERGIQLAHDGLKLGVGDGFGGENEGRPDLYVGHDGLGDVGVQAQRRGLDDGVDRHVFLDVLARRDVLDLHDAVEGGDDGGVLEPLFGQLHVGPELADDGAQMPAFPPHGVEARLK